jgi:hypothetical protein
MYRWMLHQLKITIQILNNFSNYLLTEKGDQSSGGTFKPFTERTQDWSWYGVQLSTSKRNCIRFGLEVQ